MALQSSSRLQQDEATRQAAPITASPSGGEGGTSGDGTTHFVSPTEPQDMDDGDIWLKVPSQ